MVDITTNTSALPAYLVDPVTGNPVTPATGGIGASASQVQGNVASATADSGNPVKVGGVYKQLPTGVANGQRQDLLVNPNGAVMIAGDINGAAVFDNVPYFIGIQGKNQSASGGAIYPLGVLNGYYNPTSNTNYTARGDTTGAWTHSPPTTPSDSLSNTIAASGGTATVAYVNTSMRQEFINSGTATLWVRWGSAAAVNGAGSIPVLAGGSYTAPGNVAGTLNILSTAASSPFTVIRYS